MGRNHLDNELTEIEYQVLRAVPKNEAYWTSDIAHDARMSTAQTRRVLLQLEEYGEVERVVKGIPTSWRRTPDPT